MPYCAQVGEIRVVSSDWVELHRRAQVELPAVRVPLDAFVARAKALPHALEPSLATDLYLAVACEGADPVAIAAFEERYAPLITRTAARLGALGLSGNEFKQVLRVQLFVSEQGRAPHIASYSGRGPLGGWLRVVATRLAMQFIETGRKREARHTTEFASLESLAVEELPDGAVAKREVRGALQRAIDVGSRAIGAEARALLRQYYVHGVGVDGVAKLLGVHRSNASRAVARARASFVNEVRACLSNDFGYLGAELESVVGLMRSDLELSLRGVLGSSDRT